MPNPKQANPKLKRGSPVVAPLTASAPRMGKAHQILIGDPRKSVFSFYKQKQKIYESQYPDIPKQKQTWLTWLDRTERLPGEVHTQICQRVKRQKQHKQQQGCLSGSFWEQFRLPSVDLTLSAQTFYNCLDHADGAQRDSQRQRHPPW